MSKEIKFRAWDTKNKAMEGAESWLFITQTGRVYMSGPLMFLWMVPQNQYILMQFTGLKDKNGKEIYEGDILKVSGGDREARNIEVFYSESAGAIVVEDNWGDTEVMPVGWAIMEWRVGNEDCEIIGNIYENSELLATKNNL